MITLGVPTLNRYVDLGHLITTAELGTVPPDRYVIIDNGGTLNIESFVAQEKITVMRPNSNLGVAASWNLLIESQPEQLIIANDDVQMLPTTVELMIEHTQLHPDHGFIALAGPTAWSLFIHRKWLFDQIGRYDEHFWPAYFEDNDMFYRMTLAGIHLENVPNCSYRHIGSATLHAYSPAELEAHHQRFRSNQSYYLNKWGGLPHEERYRLPFGP